MYACRVVFDQEYSQAAGEEAVREFSSLVELVNDIRLETTQ